MKHTISTREQIKIPTYELIALISSHHGQEIPNGAIVKTSGPYRDGTISEITVTWDKESKDGGK